MRWYHRYWKDMLMVVLFIYGGLLYALARGNMVTPMPYVLGLGAAIFLIVHTKAAWVIGGIALIATAVCIMNFTSNSTIGVIAVVLIGAGVGVSTRPFIEPDLG
jgi:hypothetical protein